MTNGLFNIAIATIFAREVLEGSIIVVNYRSIIYNKDDWDEARKKESLRAVTVAALIATFVAAVLVICVAVPLGILGRDLDKTYVELVEAISKAVATIFILHFSLKIPVWLGVYEKVPLCGLKKVLKSVFCAKKEQAAEEEKEDLNELTLAEIRFNVMWNLWREVAECGVFLIPFFLGSGSRAIPLSGLVGIAVALVLAAVIYQANQRLHNKCWLAFFMAGLTLMLSVGLFVGSVSEFQEVVHAFEAEGEGSGDSEDSSYVYEVENEFWADNRFPMALLKPFGYTNERTVAQICSFWLYLAFGASLHWVLYYRSKQARANRSPSSKQIDEESQEGNSSDEEGVKKDNKSEVSVPTVDSDP